MSRARRRLPVIADADTGYGEMLNVARAVEEFEHAGLAGIHLEDQVAPKRCGHLDGKQVIPAAEMAKKIRAAVARAHGSGFLPDRPHRCAQRPRPAGCHRSRQPLPGCRRGRHLPGVASERGGVRAVCARRCARRCWRT